MAAITIAGTWFSDGANYHQRGRARGLLRTARGRWVWHLESCWIDEPSSCFEAATDLDGRPYNASEVEEFLARYGSDDDLELWREDIGIPIPLA